MDRVIRNENEVLSATCEIGKSLGLMDCNSYYFEDISFKEQLEVVSKSNLSIVEG